MRAILAAVQTFVSQNLRCRRRFPLQPFVHGSRHHGRSHLAHRAAVRSKHGEIPYESGRETTRTPVGGAEIREAQCRTADEQDTQDSRLAMDARAAMRKGLPPSVAREDKDHVLKFLRIRPSVSDNALHSKTSSSTAMASITASHGSMGNKRIEKTTTPDRKAPENANTRKEKMMMSTSMPAKRYSPRRETSNFEQTHFKLFLLGALAAVATNYLLTFIATLPVVRRLVSTFIWKTDWPKAGLEEATTSEASDVGEIGSRTPPSIAQLEAEMENADGEDVEWVNMCWRKAWRVYQRGLEQWLSDLLQPVFDNLVAEGMVPRFVQRLRIAEFTLDHEAPYFSNMRRRNSRKDSDLNGVVDVRYTGGARMLLLIECGTGRWRIKVPVLVSDLDLECKMWIKVRLAPMCPWIGTLSLAFVGLPTIKVQLSPYNRVRLMSIPILQPFLTKLLTVDLPGLITLPDKLEIHIPPAVTAVAEAAVGRDAVMRAVASAVLQADALEHALVSALPLGPQGAAGGISLPELFQGELQVTLREARDLPVWGFPWQSNPYCRLTLGAQAVRSRKDSETSLPSRHRAPVWNQEFQFLVEDPAVQQLELVIRDSPMTGRTEIGHARLHLSSLSKDGTVDVWLPVESTMPGERQQGAVRLSVVYKPFTDEDSDAGIPENETLKALLAIGNELEDERSAIIDVKSAADASSRANVAASAAAAAIAVTKAAAARAAARLARRAKGVSETSENGGDKNLAEEDGIIVASEGAKTLEGAAERAIDASIVRDAVARQQAPVEDQKRSEEREIELNGVKMIRREGFAEKKGSSLEEEDGSGGSGFSRSMEASDVSTELLRGEAELSSLPKDIDGLRREAAVKELENMAKTMQQLTAEVQTLNATKGGDAMAAAEAAAKAVATAEALAVAAVVAGDVASANAALQEAAAALEGTAVIVEKGNGRNSALNVGDGDTSDDVARDHEVEGELFEPASYNGYGTGNGKDGTHEKENTPQVSVSKPLTPEERAAQALAAAQQAAAAAALALEALDADGGDERRSYELDTTGKPRDSSAEWTASTQERVLPRLDSRHVSDTDNVDLPFVPSKSALSLKTQERSNNDNESELAADAIPSTTSEHMGLSLSSSTPREVGDYLEQSQEKPPAKSGGQEKSTEGLEHHADNKRGSEWWNQALDMVPGVPSVRNIAADTAADADGSAGIQLSQLMDLDEEIYVSSLASMVDQDQRRLGRTSRQKRKEKASDSTKDEEKDNTLPSSGGGGGWWSAVKGWFDRSKEKEEGTHGDDDRDASSALKELSGLNEKIQSQKTEEAIGDIILSPDVPIEEIAAEVQKSWKLRDRHVELLVNKALENMQKEKERPWLILTAIMTTSSAILLAIVLYQILHGP